MIFKTCPNCSQNWQDRQSFLSDPAMKLLGYQANFVNLEAGLFLFNHDTSDCKTSLAIPAREFTDMHEGPVFQDRLTNTQKCCGYCMHQNELRPCPNKCECAYVRDVLDKVRNWPKQKKDAA